MLKELEAEKKTNKNCLRKNWGKIVKYGIEV